MESSILVISFSCFGRRVDCRVIAIECSSSKCVARVSVLVQSAANDASRICWLLLNCWIVLKERFSVLNGCLLVWSGTVIYDRWVLLNIFSVLRSNAFVSFVWLWMKRVLLV